MIILAVNDYIDYQALGVRIRLARKNVQMTQEQLAEACFLSSAHIGHIERGTRIPSLDTILKISHTLNVSLDWLLLDEQCTVDQTLLAVCSIMKGKSKEKTRRFINAVKLLADNIDDM